MCVLNFEQPLYYMGTSLVMSRISENIRVHDLISQEKIKKKWLDGQEKRTKFVELTDLNDTAYMFIPSCPKLSRL